MTSESHSFDTVTLGSDAAWSPFGRACQASLIGLIAFALVSGCAHPVATGKSAVALDELLAFSNPKLCEPAAVHDRLLRAMVTGDADQGIRAGKIDAPSTLRQAFGPITVTEDDNYWLVHVDVSGTLFGVPLVQITQALPHGGDPGDVIYTFDAPVARVEPALRAAGFPAKANETVQLGPPNVYDHVMNLLPDENHPGRSLFVCGLQ